MAFFWQMGWRWWHSLLPLDQLGKLVISHISLHPPYIKILGSQLSESFLLGNESLQGSSGSDASARCWCRCLWNRQVENRCQICSTEQWKGFCMFLALLRLHVSKFHLVFPQKFPLTKRRFGLFIPKMLSHFDIVCLWFFMLFFQFFFKQVQWNTCSIAARDL